MRCRSGESAIKEHGDNPLEEAPEGEHRAQLRRLWDLVGEQLSSAVLRRDLRGFRSQKGIYKPAGSPYALWVRETLRGAYPDEAPHVSHDGTWRYRYTGEGRHGRIDPGLDTNRALLRCKNDGVPVGVLRQRSRGAGSSTYEVLGLAFVEAFDGTHFTLRGIGMHEEGEAATSASDGMFRPFEERRAFEESFRLRRDRQFSTAVRWAYRERCSLCELGFRIRGRPVALEAAHLIPAEDRGTSTDVRNGVLLCRNHHALLDQFAWAPDEDLRVRVSRDREFRQTAGANHILKLEGMRLPNLPLEKENWPAGEALRYRYRLFEHA